MWNIIKSLFILLIELNIYFCLGTMMARIKFFPSAETYSWKFVYGFLGYHVLFWCIAFPCTMGNASVSTLTVLWSIFLYVLLALLIWFGGFKELIGTYKELFLMLLRYKIYVVPCMALLVFLVYYVCTNGQSDWDAQFYIGEVTARLDANRLAGIDPYMGFEVSGISWKHAFTMIGANSAVLCKIFHIRPLVFCRTVRAAINIFLLMAASFEFYWWVYRGKKHRFEYTVMALMLSGAFLFLFANTIYTPSAFILHRTYEGKAYCGGLGLVLINQVIKLCETNDRRYFFLLFMCMLTSMSICASSVFLMPVMAGSMIIAYVLHSHRWKYLLAYMAAILPNIVYCIVYILKIQVLS